MTIQVIRAVRQRISLYFLCGAVKNRDRVARTSVPRKIFDSCRACKPNSVCRSFSSRWTWVPHPSFFCRGGDFPATGLSRPTAKRRR
jgi:hypothetical protein